MVENSCNRELNDPVEILKVEEPSEDLIRVEDNDKLEYNGELEYGELKHRMEILRNWHDSFVCETWAASSWLTSLI